MCSMACLFVINGGWHFNMNCTQLRLMESGQILFAATTFNQYLSFCLLLNKAMLVKKMQMVDLPNGTPTLSPSTVTQN